MSNQPNTHLLLLTLLVLSGTLAGCSSELAVAGNLTSMVVTFGLFYSTLNFVKR